MLQPFRSASVSTIFPGWPDGSVFVGSPLVLHRLLRLLGKAALPAKYPFCSVQDGSIFFFLLLRQWLLPEPCTAGLLSSKLEEHHLALFVPFH